MGINLEDMNHFSGANAEVGQKRKGFQLSPSH